MGDQLLWAVSVCRVTQRRHSAGEAPGRVETHAPCSCRLQREANEFTKQAEEFLQQAREARRHASELESQLDHARKAPAPSVSSSCCAPSILEHCSFASSAMVHTMRTLDNILETQSTCTCWTPAHPNRNMFLRTDAVVRSRSVCFQSRTHRRRSPSWKLLGSDSSDPAKDPNQRREVVARSAQELEQEMSEETALERDAVQKEEKAHQMEDELRRLEQQHERDVKEYRCAAPRSQSAIARLCCRSSCTNRSASELTMSHQA